MGRKTLLSRLGDKICTVNRRLILAMACYLVLAAAALFVFLPARSSHERFLLGLVLFVIAFLAVKTLVHAQDE